MQLQVVQNSAMPAFSHHNRWLKCRRCEIGQHAVKHVLFRGTIPCDVLFIGEAPGKTEDATGLPFVGASGKLLNEWIEYAFGQLGEICPESWMPKYAITNVVACRPCGGRGTPNRPPSKFEKENCHSRLEEFLEIAGPSLIVTVGKHAAEVSLQTSAVREEIKHPAAALYSGGRGSRVDLESRDKLARILKENLLCLKSR